MHRIMSIITSALPFFKRLGNLTIKEFTDIIITDVIAGH